MHPLRGAIFESFVVSECLKLFLHHGERAPLYFWRDSNGIEVDVLLDIGVNRVPVEAKAGETVAAGGRPGYAVPRTVLVYGGDEWYERRGHDVRPWWACP